MAYAGHSSLCSSHCTMMVLAGVHVVVSCSLACMWPSADLKGGLLRWACPAQALLHTAWGLGICAHVGSMFLSCGVHAVACVSKFVTTQHCIHPRSHSGNSDNAAMPSDSFMLRILLTGHLIMAGSEHSAATTCMKSIEAALLTQAVQHCNLQPLTTPMDASTQCTHGACRERNIRLLVTPARHDVLAAKPDYFTCMSGTHHLCILATM